MRFWSVALVILALGALTLALLPRPAAAGSCGVPFRVSTPYCAPATVVHETPYVSPAIIYQTIVVPATTFQFLPAVAAGVPVVAGAQGAAAVQGGGVAAQAATPQHVAAPASAPAAAPPPVASAGQQLDLPVALPDGNAAAGTTEATLPRTAPRGDPQPAERPVSAPSGDVVGVLSNRCAKCHTGPQADGPRGQPFTIFSSGSSLAALTDFQKARIALRARRATMPPAAKGDAKHPAACSDPECEALDAWAEQ